MLRAWGFTQDESRAGVLPGPVQAMDLSSMTIAVQGQLMAAIEMPGLNRPDGCERARQVTNHASAARTVQ